MNQNSENDVRKNGAGDQRSAEPSPFGPLIEPSKQNGQQPYVPKAEKQELAIKKNPGVLLTGAAIIVVAILFVLAKIPHPAVPAKTTMLPNGNHDAEPSASPKSVGTNNSLPLSDSEVRHQEQPDEKEPVDPNDISRTAQPRPQEQSLPASVGGVTPFNKQDHWKAPDFPGNGQATDSELSLVSVDARAEHDALDKPSLVFVKNAQTVSAGTKTELRGVPIDLGIGLPPGTRLRARLESAVNTAVRTPVVAVVEYNYESRGEIVVPAGTEVFGHLDVADSSGFVGVRFDSMALPDGSSVDLEGAATDLQFRPLRGKVEGRHRGKNILVRSVSGVGQIAATLAGRGSLNQPLSEGDLLRERVSDNIAQASDQEVNKLAVAEHLVVTIPADTEIYVVLQRPAKAELQLKSGATAVSGSSATRQNMDQLRQLLQLQKELNQETTAAASDQ
jgi:hypothetical protein